MKSTLKAVATAIVLTVALAACAQTGNTGTASVYQHAIAVGGAR